MLAGFLHVSTPTMKGTQMDNQLKLGAVLLGGYLLGRTKKGGMATRMAIRMAMNGQDMQPKELARDNAAKLLQSDLVAGLRAQLMEVAKAAFDARVAALAQNLTDRTEALTSGAGQATDTAGDTAGQATDTVSDTVSGVTGQGKDDDQKEETDEPEDQAGESEPDSEEGEGDTADDQPDPDDESEGDGSDSSEAEPEESVDEVSDEGGGMSEEPTDEASDEDKEQALQDRITELKSRKYKIADLREMAKEMYEEDDVADASKTDLATWIAEAEAEDEDGDAEGAV